MTNPAARHGHDIGRRDAGVRDASHERRAAPTRERTPAPAPLAAAGNQALQQLYAGGALRPRPTIAGRFDAEEREADRFADAFVGGAAGPARRAAFPGVARDRAGPHLARKPATASPFSGGHLGRQMQLSRGEPLAPPVRRRYEDFFGSDLSSVRIHTDSDAQQAAAGVSALAFTHGHDLYFAAGRFDPHGSEGHRLLAHELTHALQQADHPEPARIHRSPSSDAESQVCSIDEAPACYAQEQPLVCEAPPDSSPDAPAGLGLSGAADERVAAFKELVKITAIQRLIGNQRSLDKWAALIRDRIPTEVLASAGLEQSGGLRAFMEMQDIRNPMLREIRAQQAIGRFRACTGCHLENYAWGWAASQTRWGPEWQSPNERRRGEPAPGSEFAPRFSHSSGLGTPQDPAFFAAWLRGDGSASAQGGTNTPASAAASAYRPPTGSAEGALNSAMPDPERVPELMEQARPILTALGPDGYKVLPASILGELETGSPATLRADVLDSIAQRQRDYGELIGMIRSGEVTYDHFGPIIQSLLPLADAEVRAAIQQEMDDSAFWGRVESIAVGVLSFAALLLAIFPPASALAAAAAGALDVTLATYGALTGPGMMRTGHAYSLGTGADDVFTREQQESGGSMMLGGFVGVVLAPLGVAGGTARIAGGLSRLGTAAESTTALMRVGQTIERGEFVATMAEDGSIVATSASHPDMLIIVRGDTATLYQSMGPGGMRVLATRSLSEAGSFGKAAGALGAGESTPLLTSGAEAMPGMNFGAQAQRLDDIIRTGGALPEDTRAIAAAIVDVPGYTGPTELRAVSSASTDALGEGASVAHASTPQTRTLSTARSIQGASARGEFPFSHVNDAEIKLYEQIRSQLPPNATGRIHILSLRSRLGGTVIEPLPMCSSCTHATFQQIGDFPGVDVISHSATFPAPTVDVGP